MCEPYQGFTGPGLASLHSGPFPGRPLQALTWPGKGHLGPCVPSQKLRSRAQALIAHSSVTFCHTRPFLGDLPCFTVHGKAEGSITWLAAGDKCGRRGSLLLLENLPWVC